MTVIDEEIHHARRAAIRNGLADTGMDLDVAERWCDAVEAEATRQRIIRSSAYWAIGKLWIEAQRSARKRPPS
ncbi:MAG: hypothetical protein Q7S35_05030 [Candidatus Limnocylindrales bacterium]|nr:hypothetical protein [Candidatus Limnocylindrales bacterium]